MSINLTLAQLAATQTRKNVEERYRIRFALTRRLCNKGLSRDAILNLYRFLDWVLSLPKDLEIRYNEEIKQLQEEQTMDYITSTERIGIEKGYKQGMLQGTLQGEHKLLTILLKQKFPTIADTYLERVEQEQDEKKLCAWGAEVINANTPDEIFNQE